MAIKYPKNVHSAYAGGEHGTPVASPMTDPKLPARPNQGDAGTDKVSESVCGKNRQSPNARSADGKSGGGRLAKPDNTPGRGTRGHGTTHENIGR